VWCACPTVHLVRHIILFEGVFCREAFCCPIVSSRNAKRFLSALHFSLNLLCRRQSSFVSWRNESSVHGKVTAVKHLGILLHNPRIHLCFTSFWTDSLHAGDPYSCLVRCNDFSDSESHKFLGKLSGKHGQYFRKLCFKWPTGQQIIGSDSYFHSPLTHGTKMNPRRVTPHFVGQVVFL
jgi:hypothetical protein